MKDGEAAPRPFKFLGSYAFSPVPKDCLSGLQVDRQPGRQGEGQLSVSLKWVGVVLVGVSCLA